MEKNFLSLIYPAFSDTDGRLMWWILERLRTLPDQVQSLGDH